MENNAIHKIKEEARRLFDWSVNQIIELHQKCQQEPSNQDTKIRLNNVIQQLNTRIHQVNGRIWAYHKNKQIEPSDITDKLNKMLETLVQQQTQDNNLNESSTVATVVQLLTSNNFDLRNCSSSNTLQQHPEFLAQVTNPKHIKPATPETTIANTKHKMQTNAPSPAKEITNNQPTSDQDNTPTPSPQNPHSSAL